MDDKKGVGMIESTITHAEFSTPLENAAVQFPEVTWWRHPGLRKLYFMMPILFLGMPPKLEEWFHLVTNLVRGFDKWIRWLFVEWIADHDPVAGLYVPTELRCSCVKC
jgi:hypothetical protein